MGCHEAYLDGDIKFIYLYIYASANVIALHVLIYYVLDIY